jgi:integrase
MAQTLYRLSAKTVGAIKTPGRHADGGNLYLSVSKTGAKSWIFFYVRGGKQREMGFGSLNAVTLATARDKAAAARGDLANGIDPLEKRTSARAKPKAQTFGKFADEYIEAHKSDWKDDRNEDQWRNSLETHAAHIWNMPVDAIDTAAVVTVLEPIWTNIATTARRVRARIEVILDAARVRGHRSGENPARWRGHLDHLLAKKKQQVKHFAAVPYKSIPAFMANLRQQEGAGALVLEFAMLNAVRTKEVLHAPWSEIDLEEKLWKLPDARTKTGADRTIPLSTRAVEILKQMQGLDANFIFPGLRAGRPMSNGTMMAVLKRMEVSATVHGSCRSSFKDWAAETTNFENIVSEMALGHKVATEVEAAYRRGELLEKRKLLMQAWSDYSLSPPAEGGKVVPFAKQA